jgi:hypothetical protein
LISFQISRQFLSLIDSTSILQLKLRLAVAALASGSENAADKVKLLKDHQDAWHSLQISSVKTVEMQGMVNTS